MGMVREILAGLAGLGGAAGSAYYALCLWGAHDFLRSVARQTPSSITPFSIR